MATLNNKIYVMRDGTIRNAGAPEVTRALGGGFSGADG